MILLLAQSARADDYPPRKPGLWELTMASANAKLPPNSAQLCIDKATDAALYAFGMAASSKACSKSQIKVSGRVVTVDTTCQIGTSQQTTHATTTFIGDTAYHTQTNAHFDPPLYGRSDSATTHDAKWLGPCPEAMRPGDIVTATGIRMNIRDMTAAKP